MTLDPGNGEVGKEALEEVVEAGDREEVEKSGDAKVVDGVDAENLKIVDPRNGEVSEVLGVGNQEVEENKNGDRNVVEGVSAVQVTAVATVAAETLASSSPYVKPPWSAVPGHFFFLEVLKDGVIVENLEVSSKGAYMFGRSDRCDFVLEHPTISRYHAVLQYNGKGEAFVYDLGSTHGTFINKRQVKEKKYAPLPVGGIIRFGHSTRLYVLQGPTELMPEEGVSRLERLALKEAEAAQQMAIRQASLLHAKKEAAAMEGVSWGMQEDAIVDDEEENFDELTWETYKGPLTEKQQKMIEKVHKRHEKMANLKKENDAIQAKEIGQGGLTQGQQTQMARNEQRIEQLMDELESLEETLNEGIQESVGARTGKGTSKKKPVFEDEEDDVSDDEFYDRTSKRLQKKKEETGLKANVETAGSLLEKRDMLDKEIELVLSELKVEESRMSEAATSSTTHMESVDPLDAFMSNVSSKIVEDRALRFTKELESLRLEADRVEKLLKIADPGGEAARKRELKSKVSSQMQTMGNIVEHDFPVKKGMTTTVANSDAQSNKPFPVPKFGKTERSDKHYVEKVTPLVESPEDLDANGKNEIKILPFLEPPLRLGAPQVDPGRVEASTILKNGSKEESEVHSDFVGYKERKGTSSSKGRQVTVESRVDEELPDQDEAGNTAMEAVALLLRHKSGLASQGDMEAKELREGEMLPNIEAKSKVKKKRKLGPERPPLFMKDNKLELEKLMPSRGQTGDR